jgi:hypothetical protein
LISSFRRFGLERQKSGVRSQDEESLVRTFCSVFRALRSSLTAWIFLPTLPGRGTVIISPRFPRTTSRVMESIKEKPLCINAGRGERRLLWRRDFSSR